MDQAHLRIARESAANQELQKSLDAKIDTIERKLVQRSLERNSHSHSQQLPSDVIRSVLEYLALGNERFEDDEGPEDEQTEIKWQNGIPFYNWVSATQFCYKWRAVALESPELWTRIDGRSAKWAQAFIEQSKGLLLSVDTRPKYKYVKSEILFQVQRPYTDETTAINRGFIMKPAPTQKQFERLISTQAHRIRSLYVCDGFSWGSTSEMPKLEMMTISNFSMQVQNPQYLDSRRKTLHDSFYYLDPDDPYVPFKSLGLESLPALPILRSLKLQNCTSFTTTSKWNDTFPNSLPSLNHLLFRIPPKLKLDAAEVAKRCPMLSTLLLHGGIHDSGPSPPVIQSPLQCLPMLHRLEYHNVSIFNAAFIKPPTGPASFTKLVCNTGRDNRGEENALAPIILTLLKSMLSDETTQPDLLEVQIEWDNKQSRHMALISKQHDRVACHVQLDSKNCWSSLDALFLPLDKAFGTTYIPWTLTIRGESLEKQIASGSTLSQCSSVRNIVIDGGASLLSFLSSLMSRMVVNCPSNTGYYHYGHTSSGKDCAYCCTQRFSSFPSAECLHLKNIDEETWKCDDAAMQFLLDLIGRGRKGETAVPNILRIEIDESCAYPPVTLLEELKKYCTVERDGV